MTHLRRLGSLAAVVDVILGPLHRLISP